MIGESDQGLGEKQHSYKESIESITLSEVHDPIFEFFKTRKRKYGANVNV